MSEGPPKDRQDLYDRIQKSSKDEVVLQEMVRLGFWETVAGRVADPPEEIRRRQELEQLLRSLATQQTVWQNEAAARKALRKQRLEESRKKQKETKERKIRQKAESQAAWSERKKREILYLGEGVSGGLHRHEGDDARLTKYNLPLLHKPAEIAAAMNITLGELRFLAFSRQVSRISHYRRYLIPKKTGGTRRISAPMPRLKQAQRWILETILERIPTHPAAHGFLRGRSIVTNALPHAGARVVVNLDLQDFFPSIERKRIRGVFRKLGYSESAATIFSLLCSEADVETVELDGQTWYVARGERFLPQGAPTSPAITNLICRRLDARLTRVAGKLGFRYTRYADDLTFSAPREASETAEGSPGESPVQEGKRKRDGEIGKLLRRVAYAIAQEGFRLHPRKTRVLRPGRRMEATGLTVDRVPSVSRKLLRKFRATLYQIERDGPVGKKWGKSSDVIASIEGFANFVAMVSPEKGKKFREQVSRIIARHGRHGGKKRLVRRRWQPRPLPAEPLSTESISEAQAIPPVIAPPVISPSPSPGAAPQRRTPPAPPTGPVPPTPPKKPWWKFW